MLSLSGDDDLDSLLASADFLEVEHQTVLPQLSSGPARADESLAGEETTYEEDPALLLSCTDLSATPNTSSLPAVRLTVTADSNMETPMDVSDAVEPSLQLAQPNRKGLPTILTRKQKLRRKLLRADHHRAFLNKCRVAKVTPKGLKLNHQVHPIQSSGSAAASEKIGNILRKAEGEIVQTLIEHYDNLLDTTNTDLRNIEDSLRNRPTSDKEAIDSSNQPVELKEDHLKCELEKTRIEKLKTLKQPGPSQSTPARKARAKLPKGSSEKKRDAAHPYIPRSRFARNPGRSRTITGRPTRDHCGHSAAPTPPDSTPPRPRISHSLPPPYVSLYSPFPPHPVYFASPLPPKTTLHPQVLPIHPRVQQMYPGPPMHPSVQQRYSGSPMTSTDEGRTNQSLKEDERITKLVLDVVSQLAKHTHANQQGDTDGA